MTAATPSLFAVAGNVYFCRFRELESTVDAPAEYAEAIARDIRQAAEGLNRAARDLAGAKVQLLDEADRNSSELVELVAVLDDIAFQSNILALECERACAVGPGGDEVRRLLHGGAAVAADVHAWVQEAIVHAESASRVLHVISERLRAIGQTVTEKIDSAAPRPLELPAPR